MSYSHCIVCVTCGKHGAIPDPWMTNRSWLDTAPAGWVVIATQEGLESLTFCSLECAGAQ